jgi:hypothetical protein
MKLETEEALRQAMDWTERAVPAEVRAIRDSIKNARQGNEELLLAELRLHRERLKRLIRLLREEARPEEGADVASGPSRATRYRCHPRFSRAD